MRSSGKLLLHRHVLDALLDELLAADLVAVAHVQRLAPSARAARSAPRRRPARRGRPRRGSPPRRPARARPARPPCARAERCRRRTAAGMCRSRAVVDRDDVRAPRGRARPGRLRATRPARRRTRARAAPRGVHLGLARSRPDLRVTGVALGCPRSASARFVRPGASRRACPSCRRNRRREEPTPRGSSRAIFTSRVLVARIRDRVLLQEARARCRRCPARRGRGRQPRLPRFTASFWNTGTRRGTARTTTPACSPPPGSPRSFATCGEGVLAAVQQLVCLVVQRLAAWAVSRRASVNSAPGRPPCLARCCRSPPARVR